MGNLSASCPLCGGLTSDVLANQLRRGRGTVYYCALCDHGFLIPEREVDAKAYYAHDYRQEYSHAASGGATNARELFDVYRQYQQSRVDLIAPHLAADAKVLELGASAGQFLTHIRGRVGTVHAIEPDVACCRFLQDELGIEADPEFLGASRFAGERYDVICAFQVMEHVDSPAVFLRELRQSLKPGGIGFVEVPNLRDPLLSIWDVPTYRKFFYHTAHLHYFTESSLRKVATEAGFTATNTDVKFLQDYNLLNHLHWIMNDTPQATCAIGLSEIRLAGKDAAMAAWLTDRLRELNDAYVSRLAASKATSNMMVVLRNET